jgi:hypothetical protein
MFLAANEVSILYFLQLITTELLHKHISCHGYWFLLQLPANSDPNPSHHIHGYFGESLYIHETHPKFTEMMNKYRVETPLDPKNTWSVTDRKYQHIPVWQPRGGNFTHEAN